VTVSVAVDGVSKKIKVINSLKFVSKVQLTEKLSPVIMTIIPTKQVDKIYKTTNISAPQKSTC
jgi:hypothetical protein